MHILARRAGVSPEQLIATAHPNAVRVTRRDSSRIVLREPKIAAGDSLSGVHNGAPASIAVSDVTQVAIRKVSAGKTIGLILGMSVVVGGAIVAMTVGSWYDN
jgi:hypothetical protein